MHLRSPSGDARLEETLISLVARLFPLVWLGLEVAAAVIAKGRDYE